LPLHKGLASNYLQRGDIAKSVNEAIEKVGTENTRVIISDEFIPEN